MTKTTLLQLARQGHPQAIAALINASLRVQGFYVQVMKQNEALWVQVQGHRLPDQVEMVSAIARDVQQMRAADIHELTVSGHQPGNKIPAWSQKVSLRPKRGVWQKLELFLVR